MNDIKLQCIIFFPPGYWSTTGEKAERFLLFDSKTVEDDGDRVIVFATEQGLRQLSSAELYLMDGTFKVAPRLFLQLYVIRVPLGEKAVTCVYALMERKNLASYEKLFQVKFSKSTQIIPKSLQWVFLNSGYKRFFVHILVIEYFLNQISK